MNANRLRTRLLTALSLIGVTVASSGPLARSSESVFRTGAVVVTVRNAEVRENENVLGEIPQGTILTTRQVRGDRVLVTDDRDGKQTTGWVQAADLSLLAAPAPEVCAENTSANGLSRVALPASTVFSLHDVQSLRRAVRKAAEIPEETLKQIPDGWSKSPLDPTELLQPFKTLHLNKGIVLRAYQFKEGGNGNGFVWALPEGADFPEPAELLGAHFQLFKAPKPGKAFDNYMEAIEGDRSALSFLSASLLSRELSEFGALWHGNNWSTHTIVTADPWREDAVNSHDWMLNPPSKPASQWKWHVVRPKDWRPRVSVVGDTVIVSFYTYSPLGKEGIYRHVDEFRPSEYRFTTERKRLATGPREIAF